MKNKIILSIILAIASISALVAIMANNNVENASASQQFGLFSITHFDNANKSMAIVDQATSDFITATIDSNGKKVIEYSDNFAGRWLDEQGFLNIGLVANASKTRNIQRIFGIEVFYHYLNYSLNHLNNIKNATLPLIHYYDIHTLAIYEKYNRVQIYVSNSNSVYGVTSHLQKVGLYSTNSVKFVIDNYAKNKLFSSAYGGDEIFLRGGTVGFNAVCNISGFFGVVTNYHVSQPGFLVNSHRDRNSGEIRQLGTALRGHFGDRVREGVYRGPIDASFIPFEYQNAWSPTIHARTNAQVFSNIRLGRESQIIAGAPVKMIGQRTGATIGTIRNTNVTFVADCGMSITNPTRRETTNSFRTSNRMTGGDSGGPTYIIGSNGTLYLIGILMGGHDGFFGLGARTYACRISEISRMLNITPLTNDSFSSTNIGSYDMRLDRVNLTIKNSFRIPSSLNGRNVTHIGSFAFSSFVSDGVIIPYSVTNIGYRSFWRSWITSLEFETGSRLTHIGTGAFAYLWLDTINLPNSLTHIGDHAFFQGWLNHVTIPSSVICVGRNAFFSQNADEIGITWHYNPALDSETFSWQLNQVIIPYGTQTITANAFNNASRLKIIVIPNSVRNIGAKAFRNTGIANILIPPYVESINDFAFQNTNLSTITIPKSVTHLGNYVFADSSNLKTVNILQNANRGTIALGNNAFLNTHNNLQIMVQSWDCVEAYRATLNWSTFSHRITTISPPTIPPYVLPTGLTAYVGQYLYEVTLPQGWNWVSPNVLLGTAGVRYKQIRYTPINLERYLVITRTITLTVENPYSQDDWQFAGFLVIYAGNGAAFDILIIEPNISIIRLVIILQPTIEGQDLPCCCYEPYYIAYLAFTYSVSLAIGKGYKYFRFCETQEVIVLMLDHLSIGSGIRAVTRVYIFSG